jgi:hypothetical protein
VDAPAHRGEQQDPLTDALVRTDELLERIADRLQLLADVLSELVPETRGRR